MRKVFIGTALLFAALAHAASAAERINEFSVSVRIRPDAAIAVTERITYDFGAEQRHGIFRDIPFKYRARGGTFALRLFDIIVTDENGIRYPFTVSTQGSDKRIKIGDPNAYVTGIKTYVISYKVKRAINYFADHDELYWNAIGTNWKVPIANPSASVTLPAAVDPASVHIECFAGPYGSSAPCAASETSADRAMFSHGALSPGEGLTVVVGFPKGIVAKPSPIASFLETLRDNGILALPIFTLGLLFWLWRTRGRDPAGRGTIVPQYDPPRHEEVFGKSIAKEFLTPAEVGTIVDEHAQNKDVSAIIIDLAVRGYLKITHTGEAGIIFKSTDYILEQLKPGDDLKNQFEKILLKELFDYGVTLPSDTSSIAMVRLSDLKDKFRKELEEVKKEIYRATELKGYFPHNPHTVRGAYIGAGISAIVLGFFLGRVWGALGVVSFILSGVLAIIFSFAMSRRTLKGVRAKEYILGFKDYLSYAEKDRIRFHNAPEKNPERFEKLLPYAMVLGVEKEWAKQFEGIYREPPRWYHDPSGQAFSALVFTDTLGGFSSTASSTLSSAPGGGSGFGGGGGAGGGGGGGGGGSW